MWMSLFLRPLSTRSTWQCPVTMKTAADEKLGHNFHSVISVASQMHIRA